MNFQSHFFSSIDIIPIQEVKNNPLYEKLIHAQEALVIQILLDVLHEYKKVRLRISFCLSNLMMHLF